MDKKTKEIYSEVYGILNMLGENYIKKLPASLYKMILEEKLDEYNPKYNSNIELEQQGVKKETLSMIALFHLNYWCNTPKEKEKLKKILKENEEKYKEELKEKYNSDNLFKNKKQPIINRQEKLEETVAMVEYKNNILKKIINKIFSILK